MHKVPDGDRIWHRMGDVGYLDDRDRFWFCGRKAHRVTMSDRTLFTIPCEAIFNSIEEVYRSALVGVGPAGSQTPVIIVEPWPEHRPTSSSAREALGLAYFKVGDLENAFKQFEAVLDDSEGPPSIKQRMRIMLDLIASQGGPVKAAS